MTQQNIKQYVHSYAMHQVNKQIKKINKNIKLCTKELQHLSDEFSSLNKTSEFLLVEQIKQLLDTILNTKTIKDVSLLQELFSLSSNFDKYLSYDDKYFPISILVFLQPLNKIRKKLKLKPLIEFDFFNPPLPSSFTPAKIDQLQNCAYTYRQSFIKALINYYQTEGSQQSCSSLNKVFTECAKQARSKKSSDFWSLVAATMLATNVKFKNRNKILAKIEKLLSHLSHFTEEEFNDTIADKLYRLFLYKLATTKNRTPLQEELYQKHKLDFFYPREEQLKMQFVKLQDYQPKNKKQISKRIIKKDLTKILKLLDCYQQDPKEELLTKIIKRIKKTKKKISHTLETKKTTMFVAIQEKAQDILTADGKDENNIKNISDLIEQFISSYLTSENKTTITDNVTNLINNKKNSKTINNNILPISNSFPENNADKTNKENINEYVQMVLEQLQTISKITTNFKKHDSLSTTEIDEIYNCFLRIYHGACDINETKIKKYSKAMSDFWLPIKEEQIVLPDNTLALLQESLAILPLLIAQLGVEQPPLLPSVDDSILKIYKSIYATQ
jgi:hypothetical protein